MQRDATGKFISNWGIEPKKRVSVTLTNTAWHLLKEEAQKSGISRSEVIERTARSFATLSNPSFEANPCQLQPDVANSLSPHSPNKECSKRLSGDRKDFFCAIAGTHFGATKGICLVSASDTRVRSLLRRGYRGDRAV
ncbi:MAG TPA: ribbon-helix-helix protein, CopG family [Leptolyngbyaceae cyanobacterium M33_DOE_097]|uniref:Ribbon-helix-helix protein, CopG family n=1 Tax=Oscillatoriales cyanobacterium SpSt-418 TaxID=2282169 RepID=A0A7C3KF71_9CYAN|nr:ribbon-helix-helix protein, CopG family [Leptolyngbyaceae cyanobacterium M33_DOE_097]